MSLLQQIQSDLKTAYRQKNNAQKEALKYIIAQIKDAQIEKQAELTDDQVTKLLQQEIKKRQDALFLFKNAKRDALVKSEEEKLVYLIKYIPKPLSDNEIEKIIAKTIQESPLDKTNFGVMMKKVMALTAGRADGAKVASIIKSQISSFSD